MFETYIKVGKTIQVEGIDGSNKKMNATIFAIEPQIIATTRNIKVRAQLQGKMLAWCLCEVILK